MGDPKSDDWLPEGWRVEVKVRDSGKKDKFYFPPTGGFRFNSKIEVSRYLNLSHPKSEEKEGSNDQWSSNKVVIEKTVPEGLPLGWTKEIKVTKKGGRTRRDPSPAVAKKQDLEVNETPSPVTGDQSWKACEIAKHEQILNSASTGECIIVSEHTSDQYESVAKKQKLEVNRTQSSITSEHSLKSCEIAKDEQTLNLASAGEYTAVSEHTSNQCVSATKKQRLAVDRTPSSIISDQSLKSCEISKDKQILASSSTGECTAVSKHTPIQCGVGTESSSSEFPEDKGSNQTEEKCDFVRASFVEDPSRGVPEDKLLLEVGETRKEIKRAGFS